MKHKKSILDSNVFYTIVAIVAGFLIGAIFLVIAGISPAEAYAKLFRSVFSRPKYIVWTLIYAGPIILTGLSVAFSFRTGVFNIGAEGQFVVGALTACVLGIVLDLPPVIHPLVCLVGAGIAGGLWSWIVGLLKVKRGIHEVLSYIMFNWIAFYLSNYVVNLDGIHKAGSECSNNVADSARILMPEFVQTLTNCKRANWGFFIAVVAAIVVWIILEKTTIGYRFKAVGFNASGAEYAGINANRSILTAMTISGVLSGLGGAVQILGMSGRLAQYASQEGYGFQGITVALIGSSNPIGCILAGIFYGGMKYGGSKLSMINAPKEVVDIIMGCIVLLIAIQIVFRKLFQHLNKGKEA